MADALAILPPGMGTGPKPRPKPEARRLLPSDGGLLLKDPKAEACPYTFSDSPAVIHQRRVEEENSRAATLEASPETRGFLRSVEELGAQRRWEEAYQALERRTVVPSGLFLVTRAVLRWKFARHAASLDDFVAAASACGSASKAGPLGAGLACVARICLGTRACDHDRERCSAQMRPLITAWEDAERQALRRLAPGPGEPVIKDSLPSLSAPPNCAELEASDGFISGAEGVRLGYVFLKHLKEPDAPLLLHFPALGETAADYRRHPLLAQQLPAHVLVVDYRGRGSSSGSASLDSCMDDAELVVKRLGVTLVELGLQWPYAGGLVLSGLGLGASLAVHAASLFPVLFPALLLDSAASLAASGDCCASYRAKALEQLREELAGASLEVLRPLASDFSSLGDHGKLRSYRGRVLIIHGKSDELAPRETSDGLYAETTRAERREFLMVQGSCQAIVDRCEDYWRAVRQFCLKAQLETTPAGPSHLCAICAAKATSKCGRCQKVWYCGRQHQAEHWKAHRQTCAGPAKIDEKPIASVPVEQHACLAAVIALEVRSEADVEALLRCVESMLGQAMALSAVYVGWHAALNPIAELVRKGLARYQDRGADAPVLPALLVREAPEARGCGEHLRLTLGGALDELPECTWILLPELPEARELWSTRRAAVLLPLARAAAGDARVLALSCRRRARPAAHAALQPSDPAAVNGAIAAGTAELADVEPGVGDLAVRLSVLQGFLATERPQVLSHTFCYYRLLYKLSHTFGKKVLEFAAPEGEWMRWAACQGETAASHDDAASLEEDGRRGLQLLDLLQKAGGDHVDGEPAARSAMGDLRRSLERAVVRVAGGRLTVREMQELRSECVLDFLERTGLEEVIGLQRWLRDIGSEIAGRAAADFGVIITD